MTPEDFGLDRAVIQEAGGNLVRRPHSYQLGLSFRAGEKQMRQGIVIRKGDTPRQAAQALRDFAEWLEWFGGEEYLARYPKTADELGLLDEPIVPQEQHGDDDD